MPNTQKIKIVQFAKFVFAVVQNLLRDLSPELVQRHITDRVALATTLRSGLVPTPPAEQLKVTADKLIDSALNRVVVVAEPDYFTPVLDSDLPEKHKVTGAKYRREATEQGKPVTTRSAIGFVPVSP